MLIRADLHIHTDASLDGRSSLPEMTAAARKAGLDAVAVCDHNLCTPLPQCAEVLLLPATEVSTTAGHILGLCLREDLDYAALTADGLPDAEAAVAEIHRCGGVAVAAHPYQSARCDAALLDALPLDAVEGANARAAMKNPKANQQAMEMAARRGLPAIGGSDGHSAAEVGSCYTELTCDARSVDAVREALLRGRCEAVFLRNCPWLSKGLSNFRKARREKKHLLRAVIYLGYSALRTLARR